MAVDVDVAVGIGVSVDVVVVRADCVSLVIVISNNLVADVLVLVVVAGGVCVRAPRCLVPKLEGWLEATRRALC